ncbi:MAG: thiamine phosphate synthase [Synergistaceae bacterium]|nr:thiamine phosphate synthase [Synergistaceae bacterium]
MIDGCTDSGSLTRLLRVIYICGDAADSRTLEHLERLIGLGVTAVQLRLKDADGDSLFRCAAAMARLCGNMGALFFVNDRLDIAMASGADGVHLGSRDLPVREARRIAPERFLIGATARDAETAAAARRDGADYIGCGAAFRSATKPDARIIGPDGIARVASSVSIPVVGIGGIGADNATELAGTGLSGVAVSSAFAGELGVSEAERVIELIKGGILS